MPSEEDRAHVVGAFQRARFPSGGPTLREAWLGIYQVLWWFEERTGLLHVAEANELRKSRTWKERAAAAEEYIAEALDVRREDLPEMLDQMMRLPRWSEVEQRNNPLGNGLRILVAAVLRQWGDSRFEYAEEQRATRWFPGIQMPGRSEEPSIDVAVAREDGAPRAVVSCKWSIRHDRISDPTNECVTYRAAAIQRGIEDLTYYVVTNETGRSRLDKVLNQPCVEALVHVNLGLVERMWGGMTDAMQAAKVSGKLLDLVEFAQLTRTWP